MSIMDRATQYGNLFGNWKIREFIGEGSQGKTGVFRMIKNYKGFREENALKVVTVIRAHGWPEEMTDRARREFEANKDALCTHAVNEVKLMNRLAGDHYVVSYQNWDFCDWEESGQFGCDLLIQMPMLKTLKRLQETEECFSEEEIRRVGMDICHALIRCRKENIIHRDIKPANIFIQPDWKGPYMLGDFGVSRIVENGLGGDYTSIGTKYYAAPEQFPAVGQSDASYDSRVDIYSLGLTLYELANQNHLPFWEPGKGGNEEAVRQRLSGSELPPPSQSHALTEIILKACAFSPNDRFQTAEEFLDALEKLELDPYATMPVASFVQEDSLTSQKAEDIPTSKSRIETTPTPKPQPASKNPQSISKVRKAPSAFRIYTLFSNVASLVVLGGCLIVWALNVWYTSQDWIPGGIDAILLFWRDEIPIKFLFLMFAICCTILGLPMLIHSLIRQELRDQQERLGEKSLSLGDMELSPKEFIRRLTAASPGTASTERTIGEDLAELFRLYGFSMYRRFKGLLIGSIDGSRIDLCVLNYLETPRILGLLWIDGNVGRTVALRILNEQGFVLVDGTKWPRAVFENDDWRIWLEFNPILRFVDNVTLLRRTDETCEDFVCQLRYELDVPFPDMPKLQVRRFFAIGMEDLEGGAQAFEDRIATVMPSHAKWQRNIPESLASRLGISQLKCFRSLAWGSCNGEAVDFAAVSRHFLSGTQPTLLGLKFHMLRPTVERELMLREYGPEDCEIPGWRTFSGNGWHILCSFDEDDRLSCVVAVRTIPDANALAELCRLL